MKTDIFSKTYKRHAFIGFVGAIVFMIGDWFLFLYPGRQINRIADPVLQQMPLWRFIVSAWCGCVGMACMLFGFNSLYKLVAEFAGRKMKTFAAFGAIGAAGTALAHFNEGSLIPLIYKACYRMTSMENLEQICHSVRVWTVPIDIALIAFIYVQWIALYYLVLTRKVPLARVRLLIPVITLIIAGIFTTAFDGTMVAGFFAAFESLSEGMVYLLGMIVWDHIEKQRAILR